MGVAGLEGSGKSALARVLAGSQLPTSGWVVVRGAKLKGRGVGEALERGVGYVPPDRRAQAIIRTASVRASVTLAGLRRVCRLGFVRPHRERALAEQIRERWG